VVSEVSVHHDGQVMAQQRSSHHESQEVEREKVCANCFSPFILSFYSFLAASLSKMVSPTFREDLLNSLILSRNIFKYKPRGVLY
jgi:hypothetical protein